VDASDATVTAAESADRLRILDRLHVGVLVMGPRAEILAANPAAAKLLGFADGELVGKPMSLAWDMVRDDGSALPVAEVPVLRAIATRRPVRNVVVGLQRPGAEERIWLLIDAEPELGADGAVEKVVITLADVSERRKIEARLALSDRLASVGALAAGVAHQATNPLAYVFGNLEFLASELRMRAAEAPWARELLDIVVEALGGARRVRDIVHDLRTFTRGEDERRTLVDVRKVLDSALHLTWNQLRHAARVTVEADDVLPPVLATESRLGQLFVNLLANAAQAIGSGHAEQNAVRVEARQQGGRLRITVSDTGPGIAARALGRIFDPFFSAKSGDGKAGEGTGLELFICQRLVTDLGGTIGVASEVGRGTLFTVELPIASSASATPTPVPPRRPRQGRVLVVDDEPIVAGSLARALALHHDVVTATSAAAALAELATVAFDVIICDVMMPDMSGIELFQTLEERDPDQARRVIFVTGGAFTAKERTFLESRPWRTIEKPFELGALHNAVKGVLDEHGPALARS
jgi:PAS domain S-box-containing protein